MTNKYWSILSHELKELRNSKTDSFLPDMPGAFPLPSVNKRKARKSRQAVKASLHRVPVDQSDWVDENEVHSKITSKLLKLSFKKKVKNYNLNCRPGSKPSPSRLLAESSRLKGKPEWQTSAIPWTPVPEEEKDFSSADNKAAVEFLKYRIYDPMFGPLVDIQPKYNVLVECPPSYEVLLNAFEGLPKNIRRGAKEMVLQYKNIDIPIESAYSMIMEDYSYIKNHPNEPFIRPFGATSKTTFHSGLFDDEDEESDNDIGSLI